ncbi:MAG TPA: excinuclease ABC subunit UvrB [Desulfobacteraceae bacterium]|nr:excinuclease ABC subunit UvrB [Desulfobacteraceae bacterium]
MPLKPPAYRLISNFSLCGDQPAAVETLVESISGGTTHQVLLGVTGSGKTFTMAHIIARVRKPTLVIAPNKTLAAQLFGELRRFFPENAVEYFVSYYDYYQPEAYIPQSDTYIQKDASINERIDKMRHSATRALLDRDDVIIVASVSCIYGLGSPEVYHDMLLYAEQGAEMARDDAIAKLVDIQYERGETDFYRGRFRVRGDVLDIYPVHEEDKAVRIGFFGDRIESIYEIDPLTGRTIRELGRIAVYPASHYVTTTEVREKAVEAIRKELAGRLDQLRSRSMVLEAQRLEERTVFDLEMMTEMGYCHGIENYSRHLTGRPEGAPPPTLLDYFPGDFLVIIDESHITVPQIVGMYRGDRSRKETLVEHGFRLRSALDNRPLTFEEFMERVPQILYVSATPGPYELSRQTVLAEQIIRPTGLMDPEIVVRSAATQVDDLLGLVRERVSRNERVLVTTLTKASAEDLTEYYSGLGVRVRYLHSDIKTIERMEILRDLRLGVFDVLVGINLLREGLDLPEVSLVAILDADKEGFLRSERSLIQTCGRAARNIHGTVVLYGDRITESMAAAIEESNRRRSIQREYNRTHGITPATIIKNIEDDFGALYESDYITAPIASETPAVYSSLEDLESEITALQARMKEAASRLAFEEAAVFRDRIRELEKQRFEIMTLS